MLDGLTIAGFTGNGVHGSLQVGLLTGCFVHSNRGWGLAATGPSSWHDVRVTDCVVFFNVLGGRSSTAPCRRRSTSSGRASSARATPTTPRPHRRTPTPRASAWRRRSSSMLTGCSTDANTGPGLQVVNTTASAAAQLKNVQVTGCRFNRDGTGGQRTLPANSAGVHVAGPSPSNAPSAVDLVNCVVDARPHRSTPAAPGWSARATGCSPATRCSCRCSAGTVTDGVTTPYSLTGVYRLLVVDPRRGLMTAPADVRAHGLAAAGRAVWFDPGSSRLSVSSGGVVRSVALS